MSAPASSPRLRRGVGAGRCHHDGAIRSRHGPAAGRGDDMGFLSRGEISSDPVEYKRALPDSTGNVFRRKMLHAFPIH